MVETGLDVELPDERVVRSSGLQGRRLPVAGSAACRTLAATSLIGTVRCTAAGSELAAGATVGLHRRLRHHASGSQRTDPAARPGRRWSRPALRATDILILIATGSASAQ